MRARVRLTVKGDVERLKLGPDEVLLVHVHAENQPAFLEAANSIARALLNCGIAPDRWIAVPAKVLEFQVVPKGIVPTGEIPTN